MLQSRGERIRTSGLFVPNEALYQAEPHPEILPRGQYLCVPYIPKGPPLQGEIAWAAKGTENEPRRGSSLRRLGVDPEQSAEGDE